jgi:hypothetical protein
MRSFHKSNYSAASENVEDRNPLVIPEFVAKITVDTLLLKTPFGPNNRLCISSAVAASRPLKMSSNKRIDDRE